MIRRKSIPLWIKRLVLKRQENICICGCEQKVELGAAHFDHDPPVKLRAWDEPKRDTIPPQNDPNYIFARVPLCHFIKTYGPRGTHTSIDSDRHAIDKARRIANGGRKRKGAPFPGSFDSPFYKPVNGPTELRARRFPLNGNTRLSGNEATQAKSPQRSVGTRAGHKRGSPACSRVMGKQCGDERSCLSDQHCGAGVEAAAPIDTAGG